MALLTLTINNTTVNPIAYSSAGITIGAVSSLAVSYAFAKTLFFDSVFVNDVVVGNMTISTAQTTYLGFEALGFLQSNVLPFSNAGGTGTIAALNGAVVALTQDSQSVTFNITGTWVGTILFEVTNGDGTWQSVNGWAPAFDQYVGASATNGMIWIGTMGYTEVRFRASAWTSGTATVSWSAGQGTAFINQGIPGDNASAWPVSIIGSGNTAIASVNAQLEARDVINISSQYRAQSVTTSAAEAIGAASRLVNRKFISITPTNGTIYWGTSSSVTTATGSPLFPNNTLFLSFTDNVPVYVIAAVTTDVRILEGS